MDNRLDFFNCLKAHGETLSVDDSLLVLSYNNINHDCITMYYGSEDVLIALLQNEESDIVDESTKQQLTNIRKTILNAAIAICCSNQSLGQEFIIKLSDSLGVVISDEIGELLGLAKDK
jgi:hypothetical protein